MARALSAFLPPLMAPSSSVAPVEIVPASGLRRTGPRDAVRRFLTGTGLTVFVGTTTLVYEAFLLLIIASPPNWGAWGAFSEEFKIWCFSYDPRTGGMEWMAVAVMLAEPLFIVGLLIGMGRWCRPAASALSKPGSRHLGSALAGFCLGTLAIGGLYAYGRPSEGGQPPPPFPGERIRTQLLPPAFTLDDHQGRPVSSPKAGGGRVTLVTGVYALCSTTCPEILLQIKDLIAGLSPDRRARLDVLALSLNPDYDTTELMARIAEGYSLPYPQFRYANGGTRVMIPLLRDFQFAARRNPATGLVDHANLFILIDANGRIAYRFNLDQRHRPWLIAAVESLTDEAIEGRP